MNSTYNNKDFKNSYLKYKEKYLKLKYQNGGTFITLNDTIEYSDDKIVESCIPPEEEVSEYINTPFNDIISKNVFNLNDYVSKTITNNEIFWILDFNKIYNIEPNRKYFNNRYNLLKYKIPFNLSNIQILEKNFNSNLSIDNTPFFDEEKPYTYLLYGTIFGKKIDLFNSVYCNKMGEIVYNNIKTWIITKTELYKKNIRYVDKIISSNNDLINQLFFNNYYKTATKLFKVHINVKLEYLFWTMEKLIYNYDLFKEYICEFKICLNFFHYRIFRECTNKSIMTNTYTIDKIMYKTEEEESVIIVFYPADEVPINGVYNNVKNLINVLKNLFDDKYQIPLESFPRFNFRINNVIFFAIGDSTQKINYLFKKINSISVRDEYTSPKDYINLNCKVYEPISCKNYNKITKKIHNHELCKLNETNECINNNIYQYNLLINSQLQDYTIEDIYKIVGQENMYCNLNS